MILFNLLECSLIAIFILYINYSPQPSGHRNRRDRSSSRPRRGDDWSDPWMRSKSPGGRSKLRGRKKSYSSHSSFSSSRY